MNMIKKLAVICMSVMLFWGFGAVDVQAAEDKIITIESGATAKEIQAVLNENANGEYNLTIVIKKGTYKLDRTLYVYANTTIKADPEAKLIKQSRYGATLEAKILNDKGGYMTNGNITIDGGIWDSTPAKKLEGTETFRFIHCNNITIKNATLSNVPEGSHLIVFAGVQNGTISNCKFFGYNNWENTDSPKEAVQLDVAHSAKQVPTLQKDEVKWDDLPCDNITIKDCEFYEFSRGIGSHTAVAGKLHSNIKIINNTFKNLSDSAIRLYNYRDTVVSGNTISNVVEGILAYTYMEDAEKDAYFEPLNGKVDSLPDDYNIVIKDNKINNVKDAKKTWGDGIRVIGKEDTKKSKGRELSGVEITGNTITTTSRYGIFATVAPDAIISNNKITSAAKGAILVEVASDNTLISENKISKATGNGIAVYISSGVSILNNTVSSTEDAIYLLDGTSCYVGKDTDTGNTVTSSKGNGIGLSVHPDNKKVGCTATQVIGNTVVSAKQNGIETYGSTKLIIDKNTITKASADGINLNGGCASSKVTNNTITTAGGHGIRSTSSKVVTISGNKIKAYSKSSKTANGIYAFESGGTSTKSKSAIYNNTITGTGKLTGRHAIKVSNCSYSTVYKNKINKADGSGIYVMQSKNCVIGKDAKNPNTIKTTTEHGIYVTDVCTSTTVQYNKLSGVKKDGIASNKCTKLKISNNTITSTGNGIALSGGCTSSSINSNTITSAGKSGINITSSKTVTVDNNTIKKYGTKDKAASAIYAFQSGGTSTKKLTKITNNTITGTGSGTSKYGIRISNGNYTTLTSNKLNNIKGTAVYVYSSKNCTVNKCTITKPTKMGIYFTTNCGNGKIESNTIKSSADYAISLYQAPKSTIKSNTISGVSKEKAIKLSQSPGCKQSKNKIK